ncbi:unnamed protein product [Ectocarpus sp. 8 AP-2014]
MIPRNKPCLGVKRKKKTSLVAPVLLKHASVPHVLGARIYLDFSLHLAHVYNLVKRRKKQKQKRGVFAGLCDVVSKQKKKHQSICWVYTPLTFHYCTHTKARHTTY